METRTETTLAHERTVSLYLLRGISRVIGLLLEYRRVHPQTRTIGFPRAASQVVRSRKLIACWCLRAFLSLSPLLRFAFSRARVRVKQIAKRAYPQAEPEHPMSCGVENPPLPKAPSTLLLPSVTGPFAARSNLSASNCLKRVSFSPLAAAFDRAATLRRNAACNSFCNASLRSVTSRTSRNDC